MQSRRRRNFMPLAVAVLSPALALYHLLIGGTQAWLAQWLPSLGLQYPTTCVGAPSGPPWLKAAFVVELCAQALAGQSMGGMLLLAILLVSQRGRPLASHGLALVTIALSTTCFLAWIFVCLRSLLAQDF